MAGRVQGKVAIITGGASGIGRATAATLVREGASVALADIDPDGVQRVAEEITAAAGDAIGMQADASDKAAVERVVARAAERFGGVDILVNCAAIAGSGAIDDVTEEQWDRILAVNLKGVMFFCQAVLPHLRRRGGGVIVNFSSGSGFRPSGRSLAYGASKAAVAHVSRSLAYDLGTENIRVNTIAPGLTDTPMTRATFKSDDAMREAATDSILKTAMGVYLEPSDQANAVLFLVSDEARHITGQTLHVNAGSWLS